jgi:hypothetical protein
MRAYPSLELVAPDPLKPDAKVIPGLEAPNLVPVPVLFIVAVRAAR